MTTSNDLQPVQSAPLTVATPQVTPHHPALDFLKRGRVVIPTAMTLFIVISAYVVWETLVVHSGGPLQGINGISGTGITANIGEAYTWGLPVLGNDTGKDIRFESIKLLGVDGIEVVGISVAVDTPIGTADGYPPNDFPATLNQPSDLVVPAHSGFPGSYILFGVRLPDDTGVGTVDGVRIRYKHGWRTYERDYPYWLRMITPEVREREGLFP